jgi:Tfp pilus assembly protein PilN
MDLNKEIKLSELFGRRAKPPGDEAAAAPEDDKPKKERRALFSRPPRDKKEKAPKTPKAPKQPKQPKQPPGRRAKAPVVEERPTVELPQTPLMRAFNLMPGEETREKKSGRAGVPQIAVVLLGVLVFAGLAGGYLFTSAGVTSKQSELDDLRAQLAELEVPGEKPGEAAVDAEAVLEGEARTTALATALASRIAWDRVLREVSLVVPDDVWLTQLTAATPNAAPGGAAAVAPAIAAGSSPNTLAATGSAASQESVAVFLARLESIPELTSVQLLSSTRVDGDTGIVYQFSIQAGVDPLGGPPS